MDDFQMNKRYRIEWRDRYSDTVRELEGKYTGPALAGWEGQGMDVMYDIFTDDDGQMWAVREVIESEEL